MFRTAQEAEWSYEHRVVGLHDLAEYRPIGREGGHLLTTVGRIIYNEKIERALEEALGEQFDPSAYEFINRSMKKKDTTKLVDDLVQRYGAPSISQVLDAFKDVGFQYATRAGVTISKNDVQTPPSKAGDPGPLRRRSWPSIEAQYEDGEITEEERHEAVTGLWDRATNEVGEALYAHLEEMNPIFMMANSGARGSFSQIRQLAGMRGLMANPKGEIIERPIKANFMEGLTVLEYFISTHGARKGLADTALRTADSGYLTRRLVDVSQDVIIRAEDCGTEEYIESPVFQLEIDPETRRLRPTDDINTDLVGRIAAVDLTTKRGRVIVEKGKEIDRAELADLVEAWREDSEKGNVVTVQVRSVLKCEAPTGVCQACYGRSMATGNLAQIGDAVGIIAAQSIGEPGTQLTMRTFHTGGVAGADITHGLPRVVELFEARKPKGLAKMAPVDGKVTIEDSDKAITVVITDDGWRGAPRDVPAAHAALRRGRPEGDRRHSSSTRARCTRTTCSPSAARRRRTGGPTPSCTSSARCRRSTSPRAWTSTTSTSSSSSARCSRRSGSTRRATRICCPGQFVDRNEYAKINQAVIDAGGEPAQAEEIILGITKASLNTDSFLSAASFQETTKVLTDAALEGKIDRLNGLKENVIIGKLIPAATGLKRYRRIEIEPSEPLPRGIDEVGLLDHDDLAAELGLTDGESPERLRRRHRGRPLGSREHRQRRLVIAGLR